MSRGVPKVVPVSPVHPFIIGLAEIGTLLLGRIVYLENKGGRQVALVPARHIAAGQPRKEPESYDFAVL